MRHIAGDVAVGQHQHAVREGGRTRVVRDHHDRLAVFAHGITQEPQHLAAGAGIQIAGRLVREDDGRARHDRTRARHALLLAAGKLARTMVQTFLQADHPYHLPEPSAVDRLLRDLQRQKDVLLGGQRRYQIEGLEDESDLVAAQVGELLLVHGRDLKAFDDHLAGSRRVQSGHAVHQRGFSRSGRTHDRGHLAAVERDVHMVERRDLVALRAVDLGQIDRLGHDVFVDAADVPGMFGMTRHDTACFLDCVVRLQSIGTSAHNGRKGRGRLDDGRRRAERHGATA